MPQVTEFEVSQEYVEKLFVHVYFDLMQRLGSKDDLRLYNQLNMARLVRQLLIDSSGLFNLANRHHKLQIRFFLGAIGPAPADIESVPTLYDSKFIDLSNFPPGYYLHPHKIDGFLASSPMTLAGRVFIVKEIVKYVANSFGGVHLSPYLVDEDHQLLARFNETIIVNDSGVLLDQIDRISQITIAALEPLIQKIQIKHNYIS